MTIRKGTKRQTMIYKTIRTQQTNDRATRTPEKKPGVNPGASEG